MKIKKPSEPIRGKKAEKWMEDLWRELINKLFTSHSKEEVKKILESLISDYEKKIILKRLGVIAFARMGKSYRETGEALWLSPNTVSTIRKNILGSKANYRSYRRFYGGPKIYSDGFRIQKSFWQEILGDVDIWDLFMNPPRPVGMGLLNSNRENNFSLRRRKK
ncbi:MAG: hypothetical protein AAB646_00275 [Patescibacteria group bacterium]